VQEEQPLAEPPQGRRTEVDAGGGALRNTIVQPYAHIVKEQIGVGGHATQARGMTEATAHRVEDSAAWVRGWHRRWGIQPTHKGREQLDGARLPILRPGIRDLSKLTRGILFQLIGKQLIGNPHLDVVRFASEDLDIAALRLPPKPPDTPVDHVLWVATHPTLLLECKVHTLLRQDRGIGDILQQAEADHADLIVGDMNATPDHDVMRRLDDAGYRDAGEVSNEGWQPTWPANHVGILPSLPPLVRIDHVLIADSMASLGTKTVDIDGTDHLALVATVARR